MLRDGAQLDLQLIESVTESFCWMETRPWGERWDWHPFALLLNPCSPEITEMVLLGDGPASDPASGGEDGVCPCLTGSSQEGGTKTPSVSCSPISSPIPFPNVGCTLPPTPQDKTQVSCKSGLETSGKTKRKRRGAHFAIRDVHREKKKKEKRKCHWKCNSSSLLLRRLPWHCRCLLGMEVSVAVGQPGVGQTHLVAPLAVAMARGGLPACPGDAAGLGRSCAKLVAHGARDAR